MPKAQSAAVRGLNRIFLGGCLLLGAGVFPAWAATPTVTKMLDYQPRQDAAIATPTAAEQPSCKVELDKAGQGSAWVLKDPTGRMLRRFYAAKERVDTWSYYKDGVEVYRETDTTGTGRPDQYRWLNSGGSKWGVDVDKDGKIDHWRTISPEEVSQEVLRALATRDYARLAALMLSDDDAKTLGLSKELSESYAEKRKGARAKFEATIAKLTKLTNKAAWMHLELPAPESIPAEQIGTKVDLVRYPRGTVLFESGGSNEWFQVGALVQVGASWKIIDAPVAGAATLDEPKDGSKTLDLDPQVQKLVEALTAHDKKMPTTAGPAAVKHHLDRADVLEKIVAAVKATEREQWIRQVADSLASAAQSSTTETVAATRLTSLETQLVKHMPGSNLAGYVAFRKMQAEYSKALASSGQKDFDKVQKEWLDKLTGFVKDYAKAEDTPDALLQIGMVCEFLGKDVEAKNWYSSLAKNFADKPQGQKGAGAAARLDLEGTAMKLSGPQLGETTTFDLAKLEGKVVVVYYWASWNNQAVGDFAKLKSIVDTYKDVAILGVNLDTTEDDAKAFVKKHSIAGTQLYQPGGLDSKLATQYGVLVLPSVFVVGKDGKCINKSAQIGNLEDEIKKAVKK